MISSEKTTIADTSNQKENSAAPVSIIGKQQVVVENGKYTPEILWAMGRIGDYAASPDLKQIVYSIAYFSVKENKEHVVLHLMNQDGTNDVLLTETAYNESSPVWIKDGSKIAYLSDASGCSQIWEMNPDGTERKQLSFFEKDIDSFKFAPDGQHILFIAQRHYPCRVYLS